MIPELDCFDLTRLPGATDEHRQFRDAIRRYVANEVSPYVTEWDEAGTFPREMYRKAADMGLLGLGYPAEYGGTPCDSLTRLIARIEMCQAGCGGFNASMGSHTIMVGPLLAAAPESLRQQVLPRIFAGEAIGALAITEADGGSDVARLRTRAEPAAGGWKVNGSKIFITSGMRADYYLVAARTGGPGASGLSLFLIDRDTPGFTRAPLKKMGWWCSDTAELSFSDCFVPADRMIGPENGGFRLVMQNFNSERLSMAAGGLGFAIACIEDAIVWAKQRVTFGQTLVNHQVVRQKIVRMIEEALATQAWVAQLSQRFDADGPAPAAEIALAKNHAARLMRDCADQAVQILGGSGFMRGSRAERIYREAKVMMIGGGAEEILNDLAARQLGIL